MEHHWTVDTPSVPLAWPVQLGWRSLKGTNDEDEEKDALDAANEEVMEGDEKSALELEDARALHTSRRC